MPPMVPALPRSDSKARLLHHLGLDMRDMMHRRLYNLMKLEASEGRKRIIAILDARAQRGSSQEGNQTSYSTSQIEEALMDAEAQRIYATAQPATRSLYDLAIDPALPDRPNWIIRWMLWHVFRYRDGRQQSGNQRGSARDAALNHELSMITTSNITEAAATPTTTTTMMATTTATIRSVSSVPASAILPSGKKQFFDPVREKYRT
ncbi:uncharacterized protein SEPMUDRAFT_148616 [Sphaerulina musiva SO2202]|uniref:Uncharacterized protein n=1 Tax=Sphaerulina musiva (strain SO2202) TaxID=692275 RepID=M3D5V4_SPHMS|nr:uncharacterized protein SEPMUDRAFT_148616 [Sphaerulina musiva SO2202]EMF13259.1 hypothetical protein SEPMUDRAFT_148616 [Sphaerulina musiva SO2202]